MTRVRFGNGHFAPIAFNNVFNELFNSPSEVARRPSSRLNSAVNVVEKENATELHIALPGIDKEDVDIRLNKDILEISVSREEENVKEEKTDKYLSLEFDFSSFKRSFHIPKTVDEKKIDAHFSNGVLIIELPKKEVVVIAPKKIAIK